MPHASVGELELYYETFGLRDDQPVVLIAGLGAQCLSWPDGFCEGLADRALFVVRFDNRDIGLSTKLDHLEYSFDAALASHADGVTTEPPYQLSDMAADVIGLLDAMDLGAAHLVGMSLGGMIAQIAAINHPDRVLSLTSLMSTTGNPEVGEATPEAIASLMQPGPSTREESIAMGIDQRRTWGSSGQLDEVALTAQFGEQWDRDHHPTAAQRQYGAAFNAPDREAELGELVIPTLVVHGDSDPLIDLSGGQRTAELIPGAELLILEGMAHDLPSAYWAPVIEAILALVIGARR